MLPSIIRVRAPGASATDDQLEPGRDTAQVVLPCLLGYATRAEDPGHVRVLHVHPQANPAVQTKLRPAVRDKTDVPGVDVVSRLRKRRGFLIAVGTDAGRGVWPHPRQAGETEPISARDLERRDRRGERNAQPERLAAAEVRALARLPEPRCGELGEEAIVEHDLDTAAEERKVGLLERSVEGIRRRERLIGRHHEWPERNPRRILRRSRSGNRQAGQEQRDASHFANPSPRSAARASTRPNPNSSSRPVLPRSMAVFSSASSMTAGSVIPCCMSMAATPATCGAAIDVPM